MSKAGLLAATIAAVTLISGCSLERKEGVGVRIRLEPGADSLSLGQELFSSVLAIPSPTRSLGGLSDLNCYFVTIAGGPLGAGARSCGDSLQGAVILGAFPGIDSVFETSLPVGDDMQFRGFGMKGTACLDINAEIRADQSGHHGGADDAEESAIFPLGSVTKSIGVGGDVVSVPVSYRMDSGFTCGSNSLATLGSDAFNYANGNLESVAGGAWDAPPSGYSSLAVASGKINHSSDAVTRGHYFRHLVSTRRGRVKLWLSFEGIDANTEFSLGIGNTRTNAPSAGPLCSFRPNGVGSRYNKAGHFGGTTSDTIFTDQSAGMVSCEIDRVTTPGSVIVTATLYDSSGSSVKTTAMTITLAQAEGGNILFKSHPGGASSFSFDGFRIEASNNPQD